LNDAAITTNCGIRVAAKISLSVGWRTPQRPIRHSSRSLVASDARAQAAILRRANFLAIGIDTASTKSVAEIVRRWE
jgi:hypothetical protein